MDCTKYINFCCLHKGLIKVYLKCYGIFIYSLIGISKLLFSITFVDVVLYSKNILLAYLRWTYLWFSKCICYHFVRKTLTFSSKVVHLCITYQFTLVYLRQGYYQMHTLILLYSRYFHLNKIKYFASFQKISAH